MVGPVVVAVVVVVEIVVEIVGIEAVVVEVPTIQLRQHLRERDAARRTGSSIQLRSDPSCCTFYTFARQRGKKCDGHRNQRVRIAYTFYPL